MSSDDRIRNNRSFRNPVLIVGFVMTLFYFVFGGWLLLDKTLLPGIPADFRNLFAAMLLIYGFYRGWRVWADYF